LKCEEQKLKIAVRMVKANGRVAAGGRGTMAHTSYNFQSNSQESFAQKRLRVQSAVNTRTRDIGQAQREKQQLEDEARRS